MKTIMKTKTLFSLASALTIFGLAGCGTFHYEALSPVGPDPTAIIEAQRQGVLEVYTADVNPASSRLPLQSAHTDYTIFLNDGWFSKRVHNARNMSDARPKLVELAPGTYNIEAQARDANQGTFTIVVPVVIEAGRTTKVYLDGEWSPRDSSTTAKLVRMPTGQPVGWRASN